MDLNYVAIHTNNLKMEQSGRRPGMEMNYRANLDATKPSQTTTCFIIKKKCIFIGVERVTFLEKIIQDVIQII